MKPYLAPIAPKTESLVRITPREAQVLDLAHLTARDIGAQLGMAEETVKTHLKRVYLKLGVETRVQAALAWRDRRAA